MKRSQPSLTKVTRPLWSVVQIITGTLSASSRKRSPLSRVLCSARMRSAATASTLESDCRKWASSPLKWRILGLCTASSPKRSEAGPIGATIELTTSSSCSTAAGSKRRSEA